MAHIVNEDGSLVSRIYTIDNVKYEVIGTKSTGYLAIQAIDTIRNLKTGKIKDIERRDLYAYTRK